MKKLFIVIGNDATVEFEFIKNFSNVEMVSVEGLDPLAALNAVNRAILKNCSVDISQNFVFYAGTNLQFFPKNLKCPSVDMEAFWRNIHLIVNSFGDQRGDIISKLFSGALEKIVE